tara:strand:+ start:1086 stop:1853 length:768 start_codon:yes stop_codon:yes gene_type:complete
MSIHLEDVFYSIGDVQILNGVSIEIIEGEFLTVLGPNGSGKSSLMKVLAGDITPQKGKVIFDGIELKKINISKRAQVRSVMSQSQQIIYDYSVRDIVEMGWISSLNDAYEKDFYIALEEISKKCEIKDILNRRFNSLSGGEQRKVHFARTLIQLNNINQKNKYMFFDEPTANLDISHELNFMNILREKANEGFGIFLILHDLELAYNFSDKIAFMKEGKIMYHGEPNSIYENDILTQIYDVPIYFNKVENKLKYY